MKVAVTLHNDRVIVTNEGVTHFWQDGEFFCLRQGEEDANDRVVRMYAISNIHDIKITYDA
ncbi:hypothetical protein LCGC14_0629370 [marine sediment metagenome]|uniref:Uncharacterized protein n=1 Tax=marine sediment metagenome TaxID=412755 RepID=A0A0F9RLY4_9ZZZZ